MESAEIAEEKGFTRMIARREEEMQLLYETLARFQVLRGVAPVRAKNAKTNIDQQHTDIRTPYENHPCLFGRI